MSKLIVEMEMPKSCEDCPLLDERGDYPMCIATQETRGYNFDTRNKKMDKCPIKGVLPEDHGDLIDRDALLETCIYYNIDQNKSVVDADNIQDMPVIIAAERSER